MSETKQVTLSVTNGNEPEFKFGPQGRVDGEQSLRAELELWLVAVGDAEGHLLGFRHEAP